MSKCTCINTEKILLINIYLIISFFIILSIFGIKSLDYELWLKYFSTITLIQFIFQCLIIGRSGMKIISLTGIFLIFSYLFHFGQILIAGFFPDYEFKIFNFVKNLDAYYVKESAAFSLIVILAVGLGMLISNKKVLPDSLAISKNEIAKCKKAGWILILLAFPIQLYLDIGKFIISIDNGYLATFKQEVPGFLQEIGFFSFTGFGLLILGYSKQKRKAIITYSIVVIYLILTMFSGHRGHQLTIIIFLTYLLHKTTYQIDIKRVIVIIILAFLGLTLLNTIFSIREIEGMEFSIFLEVYYKKLRDNPLFEIVTEMGGTMYTPYLVMQKIPENRQYAYGLTYPMGIFSVFPNVGGIFTNINTYAYYVKNIRVSAIGGSYIGELYYNFSYFGIFFAIFIGLFVNRISQKVEYLLNQKSYFSIGYYAPLFIYMIWWCRDVFSSLLRSTIWGVIVLVIINKLLKGSTYALDNKKYPSNK